MTPPAPNPSPPHPAPYDYDPNTIDFSGLPDADYHFRLLEHLPVMHLQASVPTLAQTWHWLPDRETWEILSFMGTVAMPFVTGAALFFAYLQIRESTHGRTAELFGEIMKRWNGSDVYTSRLRLHGLTVAYEAGKAADDPAFAPYSSQGDYARDMLQWLKRTDSTTHGQYTAICDFLEYLGIMVRNGHIDGDQLFDLIGPKLLRYLRLLFPYFVSLRADQNDLAVYAHALRLHERLDSFKAFEYDYVPAQGPVGSVASSRGGNVRFAIRGMLRSFREATGLSKLP